jgi:hypothetical protein
MQKLLSQPIKVFMVCCCNRTKPIVAIYGDFPFPSGKRRKQLNSWGKTEKLNSPF